MEIWDANLLYLGYLRAIKTSKWKASTQRYKMYWLVHIAKLQQKLKSGNWFPGPTSEFVIRERGKVRLIEGNTIDDRTVFHVVCDFFLTPAIKPYILYSNGASQIGKGLDFQRNLLKKHLNQYYRRNHTNKGYIRITDFSKFYDNIVHTVVYDQFKDLNVNEEALGIIWRCLLSMRVDVNFLLNGRDNSIPKYKHDSLWYYQNVPKNKRTGKHLLSVGVYIGAQPSQVIGIYYPTRFDTLAACKYGLKESGRYQDDSYAISDSLSLLKDLSIDQEAICDDLGIYLNKKKTHIRRLDKKFKFLQHFYWITDTGEIVDKINKKQVHRFRVHLKKMAKKVRSGERTFNEIENSIYSWIMAFHRYMSKRQIDNLITLLAQLFPFELRTWRHTDRLVQFATPSKRKLIKKIYQGDLNNYGRN